MASKLSTEDIGQCLTNLIIDGEEDSVANQEDISSQSLKDRDSVHKKLCAGSQQTNLPRELIIRDKKDLVLFGEANHTHGIAIAALRGSSWEGITVTHRHRGLPELLRNELFPKRENKYEKKKKPHVQSDPNHHVDPTKLVVKEDFFAWAVFKAIEYTDRNLPTGLPYSFEERLEKVRKLCRVEPPPEGNWIPNVNATDIPEGLHVEDRVVWFQCPWVVAKEQTKTNTTAKLVEGFLDHMAKKKAKYVLIGITTSNYNNYMSRYELENILKVEGGQLKSCKLEYEFVGADKSLIHDLLRHGYKHEGFSEIHCKILDKHLTLVFERKSQ